MWGKARAVARALAGLPGLAEVALVAWAGVGMAAHHCGGFVAEWWAGGALLAVAGWLLAGWLCAGEPGQVQALLGRLAQCLGPLGLLAVEPLALMAPASVSLGGLVDCWAWGITAGLAAWWWLDGGARRVPDRLDRVLGSTRVIWAMALLWGGGLAAGTILRWYTFGQSSQDMAIYEQAVYNTLHGRFLEYSLDIRFAGLPMARFADHFEPTLLLFVPLYALWQTPAWFLLAQALVPASGAVPVALLARRWYGPGAAGFVFAALYLCFPGLHSAIWFDFHLGVLAGALVLWGTYFAVERRWRPAMVMLVLALGCKESIPGTVAMLGVFLAWCGQPRRGLALTALAVVWGVVAIKVITPYYSPTHQSFYGHLLAERGPVLDAAWPHAAAYCGRLIGYLVAIIGPVAAVCLLDPVGLLIAGPEVALNQLSGNPWMHVIMAWYHVMPAVGVLIGGIRGARWLSDRLARAVSATERSRREDVARSVLVGVAVAAGLFCYGWSRVAVDPFRLLRWPGAEAREVNRLMAQVPDEAPVLAGDGGLASHLARRRLAVYRNAPGRLDDEVLRGYQAVQYVALRVRLTQVDAAAVEARYGLAEVGHVGDLWLWRVVEGHAR